MRASFALLALPVLAAATAIPRDDGEYQCNGGTVQCCNSVQEASNPAVGALAGLLGIVLGPVTGQVGLGCSPITGIGASGTSCTSQQVCCSGNSFSGVIVVGCTPINVNL